MINDYKLVPIETDSFTRSKIYGDRIGTSMEEMFSSMEQNSRQMPSLTLLHLLKYFIILVRNDLFLNVTSLTMFNTIRSSPMLVIYTK